MTSPEFKALQRKQLDAKLSQYRALRTLHPPKKGWIHAIRNALGMTAEQLGKRLGVTKQSVVEMERREVAETITVGTLRQAAQALECDLILVLLPKSTLEETVRHQAHAKAQAERNRLLHSMRLEAQDLGVEQTLDVAKSVDAWLTQRVRHLWD